MRERANDWHSMIYGFPPTTATTDKHKMFSFHQLHGCAVLCMSFANCDDDLIHDAWPGLAHSGTKSFNELIQIKLVEYFEKIWNYYHKLETASEWKLSLVLELLLINLINMKEIKKKSLYINIIKRKTFPFSRSRVHGDLSRWVQFGFRFVKRQLEALTLRLSSSANSPPTIRLCFYALW